MAMRAEPLWVPQTPAMEGDLRPIGGPCRGAVDPAFGGMGDLADVASIGVHRENGVAAKEDDQTVGGSSITARALLVHLVSLKVGGSSITGCALVVLLASPTLSRVSTSTGGQ